MIDVFIRPADKDVIVTVAQVMLSVSLKAVIQEVMCDDRRPRLVLMGGSYNTASIERVAAPYCPVGHHG